MQLAPLNHPGALKSGVSILSQNRASIPLSGRADGGTGYSSNGKEKLTPAEFNSMALLHKEMLNAGQISPHITTKSAIPVNAGLQKPPLQLDPIAHSVKPHIRLQENTGTAPLSSLNFAEKANRPTLDPIQLSDKKKARGISSTFRSGYNSAEGNDC